MSDPLTLLADLATAEPDPVRAARLRGRCRARLARQASRTSAPRRATIPIWQPLIVVLGVGYIAEVIREALRVYGLL